MTLVDKYCLNVLKILCLSLEKGGLTIISVDNLSK